MYQKGGQGVEERWGVCVVEMEISTPISNTNCPVFG